MRSLLGFLFIYLLVKTFLIALGVGIGFLLHWIVPAIDVGMGVLIGVVATGFSIYFFGRISALPDSSTVEDPELETVSPVTYIIDPIPPLPRRRRGKRRPT